MGTKDFNLLDLFICRWRSRIVSRHIKSGDTLLDFGCGHQALFLRTVSARLRRGVGLDYDATPQRILPNLELRNDRFFDRLPFDSASFDCVTMLAVLEHVAPNEVDVLMREIHRVLKSGGSLLLTTPTPRSQPLLEFLAFRMHLISEPEIKDHKHYYPREDIETVARDNDFTVANFTYFQFGLNCFAKLRRMQGPHGS